MAAVGLIVRQPLFRAAVRADRRCGRAARFVGFRPDIAADGCVVRRDAEKKRAVVAHTAAKAGTGENRLVRYDGAGQYRQLGTKQRISGQRNLRQRCPSPSGTALLACDGDGGF